MSDSALRSAIEFRLKNTVDAITPTTKLFFDNTKADKPSSSPYVDFDILMGNSRRANLGGKRTKRSVGVLQIDCFYPKHTGMGKVTRLAEQVGKPFDEWTHTLPDGMVTFSVPKLTDRGLQGEYQVVSVSIAYRMDDHS